MYMAISTFEHGHGYPGMKPYRHAFDAYRGISTRMGIPIYNSYPVPGGRSTSQVFDVYCRIRPYHACTAKPLSRPAHVLNNVL